MALVRLAHLDDLDELAAAVAEVRSGQPMSPPANTSAKKNASPSPVTTEVTQPPTSRATPNASPPSVGHAAAAAVDHTAASRVDVAATTAPRPVSLDSPMAKAAWKEMTAGLEGLLASQADEAHDVRVGDDGSVIVSFTPANQFSKDMCDNPTNRSTLEHALASTVGGTVTLKFAIDSAATATQQAAPPAPRPTSRRQLQAEVAERPFVARAMELFAADVSKLRVTPPRTDKRS